MVKTGGDNLTVQRLTPTHYGLSAGSVDIQLPTEQENNICENDWLTFDPPSGQWESVTLVHSQLSGRLHRSSPHPCGVTQEMQLS